MDFPISHFDLIGNRMVVAMIAVLHVLVNHGLAVGMMPLVAGLEWWGRRQNDDRWDKLAYRILFFAFLFTTTVGALTGVGIWLSASLVNPASIGSLIRVFFWGWFIEWLVFITEVVLILIYFLTWKSWTGARKGAHIKVGFALAVFSWITMAIIVAILGFMMDPGNWLTDHSLLSGFLNPIYLPQLSFRTFLAVTMAALISLVLTLFFTKRGDAFRYQAIRAISLVALVAAPVVALAGWWYWSVVPETMAENLATAMTTLQFEDWHQTLLWGMLATVAATMVVVQVGVLRPWWVPRVALLVPLLGVVWLIGHFERVREFVRKPFIIGEYMYANGLRVEDYPLYAEQGVLPFATYSHPLSAAERAAIPAGLSEADVQAGKDVFMIACSRCHTGSGINAVRAHFQRMYGDEPWTPDLTTGYMEAMHFVRPYMPPFPGTAEELRQLGEYLSLLQPAPLAIAGAQQTGITPAPDATAAALGRATVATARMETLE